MGGKEGGVKKGGAVLPATKPAPHTPTPELEKRTVTDGRGKKRSTDFISWKKQSTRTCFFQETAFLAMFFRHSKKKEAMGGTPSLFLRRYHKQILPLPLLLSV